MHLAWRGPSNKEIVILEVLPRVPHLATLSMSILSSWGGHFIANVVYNYKPLLLTQAPMSDSPLTTSSISDHRGHPRVGGCAMGVRVVLEPKV
ncbi:hypothetical protein DUNSADRAFT_7439 [Dunaliella salina]|uniref:Encoded protein n=1 Tax=Dunaliella salina TaxID=3046 RepID=A0ABQ7GLB9_DUNSA|nr:hypothetical protein DUNSADRAFT_7439 [Dunaliella salina]|eukprot:KAF5835404.1 hypothetical protein DUNSADRAFT_7439 [Dunaliella salina]